MALRAGTRVFVVGVIAALAAPVRAQTVSNPGFELAGSEASRPRSWSTTGQGSYEIAWDSAVARRGVRSLRFGAVSPGGVASAVQSIPACPLRGRVIHLTGFIRTERVDTGYAALWLRQDGPGGRTLSLDNSRRLNRTREWGRWEIVTEVAADAERIVFGATKAGSGAAWFDDLTLASYPVDDSAPVSSSSCVVDPPSAAAVAYLDSALTLIRTRALRRDVVDWDQARTQALGRMIAAQDPEDAYAALEYLLDQLGDNHSLLISAGEIAAMVERTMEQAIIGEPPKGELLPGRLGYLTIPGFSGGDAEAVQAFAALIQRRIAEVDAREPCGWIVDLRGNVGGNLWPMLAGLGPVIGEGDAGFIVADTARRAWEYRDGAALLGGAPVVRVPVPYRLTAADPPVAVLTGRRTASSGEALVIAFRGRRDARTFGQPTRGISTSTLSMKLSDGAVIALATAVFADRTGRSYGSVIEPDESVPTEVTATAEDQATPEDPTVARASAWLRGQAACRP
jgi:carboxyl-terminal processing protease